MKMVPFDMQCYLIDCAFKRKVEVSEICDDKMRYALWIQIWYWNTRISFDRTRDYFTNSLSYRGLLKDMNISMIEVFI